MHIDTFSKISRAKDIGIGRAWVRKVNRGIVPMYITNYVQDGWSVSHHAIFDAQQNPLWNVMRIAPGLPGPGT
jgi:hypothetical protein